MSINQNITENESDDESHDLSVEENTTDEVGKMRNLLKKGINLAVIKENNKIAKKLNNGEEM